MKQIVVPVLLAASTVSLASPLCAQLGIAPPKKQDAQASAPKQDLAALVQQLRTADDWWPAAKGLVELAGTQQMAVLTELSAVARTAGDANVAARGRTVLAQIVMAHTAGEKRAELRGRFRALDDALADLREAIGSSSDDATKKAAGAVEQTLAKLRESVDADRVLDPKPLRVPAGTRGAPAAEPAAPAPIDEEGYRMIEVDGKNVLVPKSELPEGMEYEASFENGALVIKRFPKGRPKPPTGTGGTGKGDAKKDGAGAKQESEQP